MKPTASDSSRKLIAKPAAAAAIRPATSVPAVQVPSPRNPWHGLSFKLATEL